MNITTLVVDNIIILELSGRFDSGYKEAETNFNSITQNSNQVIIDCKNLIYINSFGLRVFLKVLKNKSKDDGNIVFCNLSEQLKTVFQITGFLHLFQVYDNIDEAINFYK